MSELGSYITYEYGILFKILSYLPGKTLDIVCNVCREWRDVAKRILMKRNKPLGYFRKVGEGWSRFDDSVKPKIVLHFQCQYGVKKLGHDFYPMITSLYGLENINSYNIVNFCFIFSKYSNGRLVVNHRLGKNSESALILCDMPGVTVHSFFHSYNICDDERLRLEIAMTNKIVSLKDTKCLVLMVGGEVQIADRIIQRYEKVSVFMVGGRGIQPPRLSSAHGEPYPDNSAVCITFNGPNVMAVGGLHELSQNMDDFLEDLSQRAGPLSPGCHRIAFLFSCINRLELFKDREVKCFQKYFPGVPVYGMWSYGEIFAQLNNGHREGHQHCLMTECSSYAILTFKKDV